MLWCRLLLISFSAIVFCLAVIGYPRLGEWGSSDQEQALIVDGLKLIFVKHGLSALNNKPDLIAELTSLAANKATPDSVNIRASTRDFGKAASHKQLQRTLPALPSLPPKRIIVQPQVPLFSRSPSRISRASELSFPHADATPAAFRETEQQQQQQHQSNEQALRAPASPPLRVTPELQVPAESVMPQAEATPSNLREEIYQQENEQFSWAPTSPQPRGIAKPRLPLLSRRPWKAFSRSSFATSASLPRISSGAHSPKTRLKDLIRHPMQSVCPSARLLPNIDPHEPATKICLGTISDPCYAFSIGINYQWDFDDYALKKLHCYVWSFDPSMEPGDYKRDPRHTFAHIGIAEHDGANTGATTLYETYRGPTGYQVATLKSLMHIYKVDKLDVVRMDVEGAEWAVLEQWTADWVWPRIGQLLMEIHMWNRGKSSGGADRWARVLEAIPMKLFHSAPNRHDIGVVTAGLANVWELGLYSEGNADKQRRLDEAGFNATVGRPTFSDFNDGRLFSDIVLDLLK